MNLVKINNRNCFCVLLLLATILRSMIPAGFMPGQGKSGLVQMVICTGSGLMTIMVDAEDAPPTGHDPNIPTHENGEAKHPCPFAPVVAQAMPVIDFIFTPVTPHTDIQPLQPVASLPKGFTHKPWFSQGPPTA